jgi:hypothetical protein
MQPRRFVVARALLCRHRALTNAPALLHLRKVAYVGQEGQGPAGCRARGLNPSRALPQPDVMTSVATMKSKFSRCLDPDGSAVVPEKWSL